MLLESFRDSICATIAWWFHGTPCELVVDVKKLLRTIDVILREVLVYAKNQPDGLKGLIHIGTCTIHTDSAQVGITIGPAIVGKF